MLLGTIWLLVLGLGVEASAASAGTNRCQAQLQELASRRAPDLHNPAWAAAEQKRQEVLAQLNQWMIDHGAEITEGHTGDAAPQQQLYLALAQIPCIKHVCEIGFNAGHSAAVWMVAQPDIQLIAFDLGEHPYAFLAQRFFAQAFPGRVTMTFGSSTEALPRLAQLLGHKCDLIVVDGGHDYPTAIKDITHMAQLANPVFNIFIMDDVNCLASYCEGPIQALQEAEGKDLVSIQMRYALLEGGMEVPWNVTQQQAAGFSAPRGFSFGSYVGLRQSGTNSSCISTAAYPTLDL